MTRKIGSLLEELDQILPESNKMRLVESKGDHIITSAINFLRLINESFSPEEAAELNKRFYSAIKNQDYRRFERGLEKVRGNK
jgi:hypothetical protein